MGAITEVDFSPVPVRVIADEDKQLLTDSVIIATGKRVRNLGLESEKYVRSVKR